MKKQEEEEEKAERAATPPVEELGVLEAPPRRELPPHLQRPQVREPGGVICIFIIIILLIMADMAY